MHWLPLVAMVIASALPFPHSPLPRLVAATTDSSRTFHNHSQNSQSTSSSESGFTTPAKVPVLDHISHGHVSQKDYRMATRKEDSEHSLPLKGLREQATKINQKTVVSEHNLLSSNTNGDTVDYKIGDLQSPGDRSDHIIQDSDLEPSRSDPEYRTTAAEGTATPGSDNTGLFGAEVSSRGMLDHVPLPQTGAQQWVSETSAGLTQRESAENTLEDMEERQRTEASEADTGDTDGVEVDMGLGPAMRDPGMGSSLGLSGPLGGDLALQAEEDLLFLDSHPRVLFSASSAPPKHPPLLLMLEMGQLSGDVEEGSGDLRDGEHVEENNDVNGDTDAGGSYQNFLLGRTDAGAPQRPRRSLSAKGSSSPGGGHGREQSVCDERSDWVIDKRTAVDIHHQTVTIVAEIPTKTGQLKQYFYETRCREDSHRTSLPGHAAHTHSDGSQQALGCRGVDKRQWNSSCQTKQSFVRALTQDANNRMGWRWIRINSSCVCVLLSRVTKNHPMVEAGSAGGVVGSRERQKTTAAGGRVEGRQVRAARRRAGQGRGS